MSPEIQNLDRNAAKLDPESYFESPQELADEHGLTRGEKLAALERWASLVDRRLAAGSEGMPTQGTEPIDGELLRQIELVRLQLEGRAEDE